VPEWEKANEGGKEGRKEGQRKDRKKTMSDKAPIKGRKGSFFFLLFLAQQPPSGPGPPHSQDF
jgi:hypothetical protein